MEDKKDRPVPRRCHFWSRLRKTLFHNEIIRRYLIINTFDGALTILGITLASLFADITDARHIILPSLGAGIAMCVSGVWGAYAAEVAELKHEVRTLEKHLLRGLQHTHIERENHKMAVIVAAVDGIAPLSAAITIIIPFFAANAQIIPMTLAYYSSLAITAAMLVFLGAFAARISHESVIKHAFRMLLAGTIIAVLFFFLETAGIV